MLALGICMLLCAHASRNAMYTLEHQSWAIEHSMTTISTFLHIAYLNAFQQHCSEFLVLSVVSCHLLALKIGVGQISVAAGQALAAVCVISGWSSSTYMHCLMSHFMMPVAENVNGLSFKMYCA